MSDISEMMKPELEPRVSISGADVLSSNTAPPPVTYLISTKRKSSHPNMISMNNWRLTVSLTIKGTISLKFRSNFSFWDPCEDEPIYSITPLLLILSGLGKE